MLLIFFNLFYMIKGNMILFNFAPGALKHLEVELPEHIVANINLESSYHSWDPGEVTPWATSSHYLAIQSEGISDHSIERKSIGSDIVSSSPYTKLKPTGAEESSPYSLRNTSSSRFSDYSMASKPYSSPTRSYSGVVHEIISKTSNFTHCNSISSPVTGTTNDRHRMPSNTLISSTILHSPSGDEHMKIGETVKLLATPTFSIDAKTVSSTLIIRRQIAVPSDETARESPFLSSLYKGMGTSQTNSITKQMSTRLNSSSLLGSPRYNHRTNSIIETEMKAIVYYSVSSLSHRSSRRGTTHHQNSNTTTEMHRFDLTRTPNTVTSTKRSLHGSLTGSVMPPFSSGPPRTAVVQPVHRNIGMYVIRSANGAPCFQLEGIFSFELRYQNTYGIKRETTIRIPSEVESVSGNCFSDNQSIVTMIIKWGRLNTLKLYFGRSSQNWFLSSFHVQIKTTHHPSLKNAVGKEIADHVQGNWFVTPYNHSFECRRKKVLPFKNGSFISEHLRIQPFDSPAGNHGNVTTCLPRGSNAKPGKLGPILIIALLPLATIVFILCFAYIIKKEQAVEEDDISYTEIVTE